MHVAALNPNFETSLEIYRPLCRWGIDMTCSYFRAPMSLQVPHSVCSSPSGIVATGVVGYLKALSLGQDRASLEGEDLIRLLEFQAGRPEFPRLLA